MLYLTLTLTLVRLKLDCSDVRSVPSFCQTACKIRRLDALSADTGYIKSLVRCYDNE